MANVFRTNEGRCALEPIGHRARKMHADNRRLHIARLVVQRVQLSLSG
jgi:hypothetical protein